MLSGDIDGNDSTDSNGVVTTTTNISGANSYHVVTGSGVTSTAVLDGFTITAGQANGGGSENNGGGIFTSNGNPTLAQVAFSGNFADFAGGGMYNIISSPVLTDVIFSGNAANYGGGMYNEYSSSPSLNNASLSGNSANGGGGIYNNLSNPELTNVSLSGNAANSAGGGIYNNNGSIPNVRNSILWHNQDSSGTGTLTATVYNDSSTITLTHSIVQGTGGSASWTTDPSLVDGGDNLDSDPLFILTVEPATAPTTSGNLRLQPTSPAINAGEDQYVTGIPTDLDGNSRISGGTVDMGAYEFQFYSLDVSLGGSGSGKVSSTPAGIDCAAGSTESDCTEIYADGTVVTLTASADSGSIFAGWNGACTNTAGDCVVTMTQVQTVTATFNRTSTAVYLPLVSR